ncbi:MAG TPA: malto-oligosyltrehalose synthase [Vicinamibacterales bacterium]|nr:malto-oligosyltrehalose synthase [Vicinamibacterales bacterium]
MDGPPPSSGVRIPRATYRLQFNRAFTFRDAEQLVPYLHELGISDGYASSYLKAVPGSQHGYDVADPTMLNPELGGEEDYAAWVKALADRGMGHVLDIVPNHMGIAKSANPWWQDVLENGPSSPYAPYFDIDWHPVKPELENKVLLPILGDQYGTVLENQELQLGVRHGAFFLRYHDRTLPVAPRSFSHILSYRLEALVAEAGEDDPAVQELQSILTAVRRLPERETQESELLAERTREKEVVKRRLDALMRDSPMVCDFVEQNVRLFNGTPGDPHSFDRLDALLSEQAYRLAHWRVASEEINYRRFFDINELASLRMEDPEVFDAVHRFLFSLIQRGAVTGLRVDHVDGLYDPGDYVRRLQGWARAELDGATGDRPLFIVVEKILSPGEELPIDWPVYGTTGYDFAATADGLFVDGRNERAFDDLYAQTVRGRPAFDQLVYQSKKLIMSMSMASDINALGHQLNRFSEKNRHYRDFTQYSLTYAIREIIASFPVYRTYITGTERVRPRDRAYVHQAVTLAKRRNPAMTPLVFDFIADLLLREADYIPADERVEQRDFIRKFQQLSSPVTAKGVEDTALYVYSRLVSLNEVGADPREFGRSPRAVHTWMADRLQQWPHALSATSTHDSKRSEDVRARIDALSEIPGTWKTAVNRWRTINRRHKAEVDGAPAPDRNDEYLLYQTLVGVWPFGGPDGAEAWDRLGQRIDRYMLKAIKEAKVHTSWVNPNAGYEAAVSRFLTALLDRTRDNLFLTEFLVFQARVAEHGIYNSLGQLLLKIAAPGIPDFYQGAELWHLCLVDPDNRDPVDYARRAQLLAGLRAPAARDALARELLDARTDGRIKLYVTQRGLACRAAHDELFREGEYLPLEPVGLRHDSAFGFVRRRHDRHVIAVLPRLVATLVPDASRPPVGRDLWADTALRLPPGVSGRFRNVFTDAVIDIPAGDGAALEVGEVLKEFPVGMLEEI